MSEHDEAPEHSLATLPELGPSDLLSARTQRRARASYANEQALAGHPVLRRARHTYSDFIAPGLLVGGAAVYLLWAIQFCNALGQGG